MCANGLIQQVSYEARLEVFFCKEFGVTFTALGGKPSKIPSTEGSAESANAADRVYLIMPLSMP